MTVGGSAGTSEEVMSSSGNLLVLHFLTLLLWIDVELHQHDLLGAIGVSLEVKACVGPLLVGLDAAHYEARHH